MPYWSSSRVGALPATQSTTPSSTSSHHGGGTGKPSKRSERFGRPKGITMEDLKKQTALRLAQEQNRDGPSPGFPGPLQQAGAPCPPPSRRMAAPSLQPRPSSHHHPHHHLQQHQSQPPPPQYHHPHAVYPPVQPPPQPYLLDATAPTTGSFPPASSSSHVETRVDVPRATNNHSPFYANHRRTPPPPFSSASQGEKAKLPHGLTVQELKEMTKARLQAEAALERGATPSPSPSPAASRETSPWPEPTQESSLTSSSASSSLPLSHWESSLTSTTSSSLSASDASRRPRAPSKSEDYATPAALDAGFNRRRAVTMSPRLTTVHTVHEHDDSEKHNNETEKLALPSLGSVWDPRPRTFSAASLPAMSHTAEEFPVVGLADVFRVSSFEKELTAPPENPRLRAWSEPLHQDLASILKLSGAESDAPNQF
uniref:Uncharacterized protein n=1 Tax=Entomoneis paludosa TaxID=265537 RepID=A0A7S2Y3P7_9STRA